MRRCVALLFSFCSTLFGYGQDGFTIEPPRLAYWQVGQSTETVIVLHGGPAVSHQYLRPEFDTLSKTARVIYYDQRGCGKSDSWSSYSWQGHVKDLKRLINTLAKDQKVFLVGSSWGTHLAMLYTYTHPEDVKGLILSGTVPWRGEEQADLPTSYLPTKVLKLLITEKRVITRSLLAGQVEQDTISVSKECTVYSGSPLYETLASLRSAPKAERLRQIHVPILIFNGVYNRGDDAAVIFKNLFTNAQLHTLAVAEHDPWFSDPSLFFSISNEFIKANSK